MDGLQMSQSSKKSETRESLRKSKEKQELSLPRPYISSGLHPKQDEKQSRLFIEKARESRRRKIEGRRIDQPIGERAAGTQTKEPLTLWLCR
jgi:hypothetical protein